MHILVKIKKTIRSIIQEIKFNINVVLLKKNIRGKIGDIPVSGLIEKSFTRTSFAQQGEDLVLERIIQNILGWDLNEKRIYVDVGAYHPINNSVTYLLYKRKWTGIAFDPSEISKNLFNKYRPRDIFINAAVGEEDNAVVDFFFPKKNDFVMENTKIPKENKEYIKQKVNQINLNNELNRKNINNFDLINIDVEGSEFEILNSLDLKKFKPRIIIIEIHAKNIHEALNTEEAKYLIQEGYKLCGVTVVTYFFVK